MGDTLKWPKDTAAIVKKRAEEQQNMSKQQAQLNMRLMVADDVRKLINKEFEGTRQKEMLRSIDMFAYFAEQAQIVVDRLKLAKDKKAALEPFKAQAAARFTERGLNVFMGADEYFAENEPFLFAYMQRGLVDFVTKWSSINAEVRGLFAEYILDNPKSYPTTLEMNEEMLFGDGKTLIQQWDPPNNMSMTDILNSWLDAEANTSIYTGTPQSGARMPKREQLKNYPTETKDPKKRRLFWISITQKVVTKKNYPWSAANLIIGFFKQNVPALTEAFKGSVPEPEVRDFVATLLPKLVAECAAGEY